jgi:hypothetical protein
MFICPVIPGKFQYLRELGVSAHGSSPTGHCSRISSFNTLFICDDPTSSVLFDGDIPELSGLDGDTWASQLLTLHQEEVFLDVFVTFDFTKTPGYKGFDGIELVVFNCGTENTNLLDVQITGSNNITDGFMLKDYSAIGAPSSCNSLVRICIGKLKSEIMARFPRISLDFGLAKWVYIGEIAFTMVSGVCHSGPVTPTTNTTTPCATTATTPESTTSATTPESTTSAITTTTPEPDSTTSVTTPVTTAETAATTDATDATTPHANTGTPSDATTASTGTIIGMHLPQECLGR